MLYINELFEFMLTAFRGLEHENSKKAYALSIMKKLAGIVVITGILFGLVLLVLLIIDGFNEHGAVAILFNNILALYIVASLPTIIDTLRALKSTASNEYRLMSVIYVFCIMILGVLLHIGGNETLFGLLDV